MSGLVIRDRSVDEVWPRALSEVLAGDRVAPRGFLTREVLGGTLIHDDPRRRLLINPLRLINPAFAAAEAVWVLAAAPDDWLLTFNRRLASYADDGVLRGAYGPRIRHWQRSLDQLYSVAEQLEEDPSSRRAVIQIFDPSIDRPSNRDVACTIAWHFLLRDGTLHMHSIMRSHDLWLGYPYDVFTATAVHEIVAGWVGASIGSFVLHVNSLHLYERDASSAARAAIHEREALPAPLGPLAVPKREFDRLLARVIALEPIRGWGGWDEISSALRAYVAHLDGDLTRALRLTDTCGEALGLAMTGWFQNSHHRSAPLQ